MKNNVSAKSYIFYEQSMFTIGRKHGDMPTTLQYISPGPLVQIQDMARHQNAINIQVY
jgi:hypothetical protein